jgi:hypothetical protein
MKWIRDSWGTGWLLVNEDYVVGSVLPGVGADILHVCACSMGDKYEHAPERYCLFVNCDYERHIGDIPFDTPEEELKALATAMWRLG